MGEEGKINTGRVSEMPLDAGLHHWARRGGLNSSHPWSSLEAGHVACGVTTVWRYTRLLRQWRVHTSIPSST